VDKIIKLNNLNIFYQEYGKGDKNILLFHGWGQSHVFWKDISARLSQEYHLYVLDLPGFGRSQEPPSVWNIKKYAKFIHAFVIKLQITKPILIGHSFGGRIAIIYASQFFVKKLILYSTGGGLPEKSLLKTVHKYVFVKIGKYLFPNFLYKCYSIFFRPKNYQNKIIINKKRSRRMLDIYSQPSQNLDQALDQIVAKTLIIVGQKDFITKPTIGREMHALIKNSELIKIPNATHFAHIEAPNIFYETVEKFLKED